MEEDRANTLYELLSFCKTYIYIYHIWLRLKFGFGFEVSWPIQRYQDSIFESYVV